MAARTRGPLNDDDSINDQSNLEMVHINAPQTTSTTIYIDPDEPTVLDDSAGTLGGSGLTSYDFLANNNPSLMEGINREYEIPNLFTYKKVRDFIYFILK
jgi:hypothetical protein